MSSTKSRLHGMTDEQVAKVKEMVEADVGYPDIANYIVKEFGIPTSPSSVSRYVRGGGLGSKRKLGAAKTALDQAEGLSRGDELAIARAQVEHLQGELSSAERAINKLRRTQVMEVALGQAVDVAVERHMQAPKVIAPYVGRRTAKGTPQEFLAHVSDAHYGETVLPEMAMGVSYSPEIARARMARLRDKIIRYKDLRPYEISKLHVAVLGDMTSGNNHEDLDVTNALGMVDQAMDVADMLYGMAQDFAAEFPAVEFTVITGNHGRIHKVPRHKQRFENWDYVSGRALARMVEKAGLPVEVVVPRGSKHVIQVAGRHIALTHGDNVKAASFAGIPFYGFKQKRDALQQLLRTLGLPQVDQISSGHFHQHIHWHDNCNIVVNGSIKGGDEFVMDTRYAATPALQIIQEWHPRYGLTCTDYINLDTLH